MDSYEGRQRLPATLHKFVYAHSGPTAGVDPSGHFLQGLAITGGLVAAQVGLLHIFSNYKHRGGRRMTGAERSKLNRARGYILSPARHSLKTAPKSIVTRRAIFARIKVWDNVYNVANTGDSAWAIAPMYGNWGTTGTIHLSVDAFELDYRLLASLLIHEAVHLGQWNPLAGC
jgi:hypothetical protein